jgi:flagellar basal body-associated protein FliL
MTGANPFFDFKKLPLRNRISLGILLASAVTIVFTTLLIIFMIIRIQFSRVEEVVSPEPTHEASAPEHHEPTTAPFTLSYELQGMSISLGNRNQTLSAYAEFTLVLDCPNKDSKRWMEMNRASIRDAVYESTIAFTVEDFSTPDGFARMKKSIVDTFKGRFGGHAPRDVAVRDWVIR